MPEQMKRLAGSDAIKFGDQSIEKTHFWPKPRWQVQRRGVTALELIGDPLSRGQHGQTAWGRRIFSSSERKSTVDGAASPSAIGPHRRRRGDLHGDLVLNDQQIAIVVDELIGRRLVFLR